MIRADIRKRKLAGKNTTKIDLIVIKDDYFSVTVHHKDQIKLFLYVSSRESHDSRQIAVPGPQCASCQSDILQFRKQNVTTCICVIADAGDFCKKVYDVCDDIRLLPNICNMQSNEL